MRLSLSLASLVLASSLGVMGGCASGVPGASANATVKAKYGQVPSGVVQFDQRGADALVYVHFAGLPTNGVYGMHIHEKGDCSGPDLLAAGGIYNPTNKPHGPQDREHMAGDLPSLFGSTEGLADARFTISGVQVSDLIGRSIIVHRYADDFHTQPEGGSGERMACGIIRG